MQPPDLERYRGWIEESVAPRVCAWDPEAPRRRFEALRAELEALVSTDELDRDYEDAIDVMLSKHEVGFAEVGDLPWTEIDFEEDLLRARDELLPRIEALGA